MILYELKNLEEKNNQLVVDLYKNGQSYITRNVNDMIEFLKTNNIVPINYKTFKEEIQERQKPTEINKEVREQLNNILYDRLVVELYMAAQEGIESLNKLMIQKKMISGVSKIAEIKSVVNLKSENQKSKINVVKEEITSKQGSLFDSLQFEGK